MGSVSPLLQRLEQKPGLRVRKFRLSPPPGRVWGCGGQASAPSPVAVVALLSEALHGHVCRPEPLGPPKVAPGSLTMPDASRSVPIRRSLSLPKDPGLAQSPGGYDGLKLPARDVAAWNRGPRCRCRSRPHGGAVGHGSRPDPGAPSRERPPGGVTFPRPPRRAGTCPQGRPSTAADHLSPQGDVPSRGYHKTPPLGQCQPLCPGRKCEATAGGDGRRGPHSLAGGIINRRPWAAT